MTAYVTSGGLRTSRRVLLLLLCIVAVRVRAEVTVEASLSHRSAEVGQTVQFQVAIGGHRGSVDPPAIKAEGLTIEYAGPSTSRQLEMSNGGFRQHVTTTFIYRVSARQAGTFQIPAVPVQVDGQTYQTQPIGFKVEKGSASSGSSEEKMAFAEISVPRKSVFLGEALPVELNFYLDANVNAELEQMPGISGSGFTTQKMPEPRQQRARKNGREWKNVSFRTAITPSKAGQITLGPLEVSFVAEVPRARSAGSRDPFDTFFNDPFFDRIRGGERRRYTVQAPAVDLEVKSLPAEGRPAEFSGAIGQFKMAAEGTPKRVKIGDPVTMRLKISGTGNFDRMQAPVLVDPTGWHPYPASENFEPSDDLKLAGTKTFEVPVVPETAQREMPRFQFGYFDPDKAKYVTLTSDAMPLTVEGSPAPAATPSPPPVSSGTAAAPPQAEANSRATDILGLRYDFGSRRSSWMPLFRQRHFLLAQVAPLALLATLFALRFLRRVSGGGQLTKLRKERDHLLRQLHRGAPGMDFYDTAARMVQVQTAMVTGQEPSTIDAAAVRRAFALDEETAAAIEDVFNARAELLYAGGGGPGHGPAEGQRTRLLAALEELGRRHA